MRSNSYWGDIDEDDAATSLRSLLDFMDECIVNISQLSITADDTVTVSTRPVKGRTTELMAKLPHFTLGCVTDRWCTTMEKMIAEHGQLLSDFEVVTIVTNKLPTEIRKELEMQTVDTPTELRRSYPADTVQKDVRLRAMQQGLDDTGKHFLEKILVVFQETSCPLPVGIDQLEAGGGDPGGGPWLRVCARCCTSRACCALVVAARSASSTAFLSTCMVGIAPEFLACLSSL